MDKGAAIYLALAAAALMDSGRYGTCTLEGALFAATHVVHQANFNIHVGQGSQSGERVSWKDNGRGRSLPMPEDVLCGRGGKCTDLLYDAC